MILKAPAKINLSLDVKGRRSNGYHDVEMIMQTVSLFDEVEIVKADNIEVLTNLPYIPDDNRNLAYRAAQVFFDHTKIKSGAIIKIKKLIPVGAGLAGGSTDAASVLTGLNELYETNLTKPELEKLGESLGADVPFFFTGGTCLAQGLGEILTPIPNNLDCWAVIIKPAFSVSTKWVYENLKADKISKHPDTKDALEAIKQGNIPLMARCMSNVLENVTAKRYHQIEKIKSELIKEGALGSLMSGSGSAVFGVYDNEKAAQVCAAVMNNKYDGVFVVKFL